MKGKGILRKCLAVICSGALLTAMAVLPPAARAAAASPSLRLTVIGQSGTLYDQTVTFDRGNTAETILNRAMAAAGISCTYNAGMLADIGGEAEILPGTAGASHFRYWSFYDNDAPAGSGLSGVKPADGDQIALALTGCDSAWNSLTQFPVVSLSDSAPKPGESFSVTVTAPSTDWSTMAVTYPPLAGVTVRFGGQTFVTGQDGTAAGLKADAAGTYDLTVGEPNADPDIPYALVAPRTFSVTVGGAPSPRQVIGAADTARTVDLNTAAAESVNVVGGGTAYVKTAGGGVPAGFHAAVRSADRTVAFLDFPSATAITGPGWDGVLALPHTASVTVGGASMPAVAVGGPAALSLSQPVKLTLPGETGKCAGYVDESGGFHTMPKLSADALLSGQDGYYDDGADLIVWTRHFSSFVAYSVSAGATDADVASDIDGAAAWLDAGNPDADWSLFALARAGKALPADYAAAVKDEMDENGPSLGSSTELEKAVLFLRATGIDPSDFYGANLVSQLSRDASLGSDGLSAQIYGLLALDSADVALPAGAPVNDAALIARILSYQKSDGAFALAADQSSDPDLTAMALTALAPHRDQAAVQTAVARALEYLVSAQQSDGGFIPAGGSRESAESAAQVIIALSTLQLDTQTYEPLLKSGTGGSHSVMDGLLSLRSSDGGFPHQAGGASDGIATQQALMALTAYRNFRSGGAALYDLRDISVKALSSAAGTEDETAGGASSEKTGAADAGETVANPQTGDGADTAPLAVTAVLGLGVLVLARQKLRRDL